MRTITSAEMEHVAGGETIAQVHVPTKKIDGGSSAFAAGKGLTYSNPGQSGSRGGGRGGGGSRPAVTKASELEVVKQVCTDIQEQVCAPPEFTGKFSPKGIEYSARFAGCKTVVRTECTTTRSAR